MVTKSNPQTLPRSRAAEAAAEEAEPCDSRSGEQLMSPQHFKSFGNLALPQLPPAEFREMLTEKNADALTPAVLTVALPSTALPCHLGTSALACALQ